MRKRKVSLTFLNLCRYQAILLTPSVTALRVEFGSLDQRIANILYTNGEIDPWLYSGMLFTRDFEAEVLTIARK